MNNARFKNQNEVITEFGNHPSLQKNKKTQKLKNLQTQE